MSLKLTRRALTLSVAALAVGLAACGPQATAPTDGESPAAGGGGGTIRITGAGASFPAPLYQRWIAEFRKTNPNIEINYQSVGSGAGVKQFLSQTVDFGATDAPLTDENRANFPAERGEPVQIPMTGGSVVFTFNLEGVDDLKLSREAYCGIVAGEVTKWNDPKIASANPGVDLPDQNITWVHRSDGSGTTFIFTTHLEAACPNWKAGSGKAVEWPAGQGAKGNEGITATVKQSSGSIGYVELAYATENNLSFASLENKSGEFIKPSPEAAAKSFEGQQLPEDFAMVIPDTDAKEGYPIVGLTWLLLYGTYDDPAKAEAVKSWIKWAYSEGAPFAKELGYLPLPQDITTKALAALDTVKVASK